MSTEKENTTPLKTAQVAHNEELVESESNKELALYSLEPKQQRFINLYMTGQYTLVKLSDLLNVHVNTLMKWLKREDIKHAIIEAQGEIHAQVHVQLKALTLKATQKLHQLVDSPIDAVALQAVKDVLDRGGHKAKQEIKIDKTVTTVEQKMKELIDNSLIDAEFEEVESE